jgi:hypothetical protein
MVAADGGDFQLSNEPPTPATDQHSSQGFDLESLVVVQDTFQWNTSSDMVTLMHCYQVMC